MAKFIQVGQALAKIRDNGLYRDNFKTFAEYCQQRWDFSRGRAYQLIGASQTFEIMSTIVDIQLPRNEAQLRPLIGLSEDKLQKVWQKLAQNKNGECLTASKIRDAVQSVKETSNQSRSRKKPATDNKNTLLQLILAISRGLDDLKQLESRNLDCPEIHEKIDALAHSVKKLEDNILSL